MKNQAQIRKKSKAGHSSNQPGAPLVPVVDMDYLNDHDPRDIGERFARRRETLNKLNDILRSGNRRVIGVAKSAIGPLYNAILTFGPESRQARKAARHIEKLTKQLRQQAKLQVSGT